MIQKWKTILTNWINCYSCDNEKRQQNITPDNLLLIFAHIHENLKLDDSKSSNFEAGTLQDFIVEKYPEFKFENGTEATNEEEVYTIASLLLFFVCVNSKNDDIKRVMCNKLSVEDQETILKFSKCLMECSPILYADVEAAVTEACGPAAGGGVAETPPALRSLHGEVRRLQAALDAERFDRNYLQDELARTQLKLDRLTKDKAQYKLEILNLKAKISLCCGEDREARSEARADDTRLQKQLQELEARLDAVQARLDDVEDERDVYKKKVEDLKQERDKWLALSQQESSRSLQLSDQLDSERRTVQSLKDLVSELRQHNRNNGLDASQLECDDPDTSIQSLHNISVCSEACANVVEVQLGEERAKIEVLKRQMQGLQDQLAEVNQRFESEQLSFEAIISEKEQNVFSLKHRIDEEIEEKINLKTQYNHEIEKLNDKICELAQTISDNEERSRLALEEKIHEIQTLQQHFAEETKKCGNIIKNLKIELEAEKFAQLKLKDDCDNRIMKLNEKVLNRNNELVELQNNIIKKSEMIEVIQSDLRREKELRDELSNSCNNQLYKLNEQRIAIENSIQEKCLEIAEYQKHLHKSEQCIQELNKTVEHLQSSVLSLEEKCQHKDGKIVEKQKEIEFINDVYQKEQEKLTHKVDERTANVKSLQMQLQNEIEYKVQLQRELTQLHTSKMSLLEEVNEVKSKSKLDLLEKESALDAMYGHLKEETKLREELKVLCETREHELRQLAEEVANKEHKIQLLENQLETETKLLRKELAAKEEIIQSTTRKLSIELKEKADLQEAFNTLHDEKTKLEAVAIEKENDLLKLKNAYEKLCRDHHENKLNLKTLEANLKDELKKNEQLQDSNEKNTSNLLLKLEKTEKSIKKIQLQSKSILDSKELQIQSLTMELSNLQAVIQSEREMVTLIKKEKEVLEEKINNEVYFKNRLEAEYHKKCNMLEETITNFKEEIVSKNKEIEKLSDTIVMLKNTCAELKTNVESEKASTVEMKEEYEKHMLELSEKELISKKEVSDKTAKIDRMLSDLKQEKELKEELSNLYHKNLTKLGEEKSKVENDYQQQVQENKLLQKEIEENVVLVEELQSEVASMKTLAASVELECSILKETNDNLLKEVETRGVEVEQSHKLLQDSIKELSDNNEKLSLSLAEKNIFVDVVKNQLQHEIELRVEYENKITELNSTINEMKEKNTELSANIMQLTNEISLKNEELLVIKKDLEEKVTTVDALTTEIDRITKDCNILTNRLQEAENHKMKLFSDNEARNRLIEELRNNILILERELSVEKENKIAEFEAANLEFLNAKDGQKRKIAEIQLLMQEKDKKIEVLEHELEEEKARTEKIIYNCDIKDAELNKISEQVVLKNNELKVLNMHIQQAIGMQEEQVLEKDDIIKAIQNKLKSELTEKEHLQSSLESLNETNSKLIADIKEKCEELCEVQAKYGDICEKFEENKKDYQSEKQVYISKLDAKENELLSLKNSLATDIERTANLKAHYDEQIEKLNQTIIQLKKEFEEECNSKTVIEKEVQEMKNNEKQLVDDKVKLENTIRNLEIEVDAEKISKLKLKEDNENLVLKLNKKITNISNELMQLQNSVIDNNKKTDLLLSDCNKEKESKEEILKKYDEEIIKLNDTKLTLENELQQKLDESRKLQERLEEKEESIEQLHKEIDDLRNYCTELQKDKRILEEAKTALITVVEDRDKKIQEFENAETVLATIVNNLESQLKGVNDTLRNREDLAETTDNKLQSEIFANTNLKNNLDSLQKELSEKLKEVDKLRVENEQLQQITSESKTTITELEAKLQEESLKIEQLTEKIDAETSKLNSLVHDLELEMKKKDLEIHQLENNRAKLHEDLTKHKDSLLTAQREIEIIESKYDEESKLKEKFRKECENQRVMLNGITEKLNQNVIVQNNEAVEMTKEIQSLRKAVEQKCEELRIAEGNICKHTQAIADLRAVKETEIENLNKKVGSLQSLNTDLDQELKNEADRKMQIIEALQKDNEQLQYIIEEENSTHEIMLKEKDRFIEELDDKLKYVNIQLEDIRRDYEDKTLMWEKLKVDADDKIQAYEAKIRELEGEKISLMKELEALKETQKEMLAVVKREKSVESKLTTSEKDTQGLHTQVDTTTSDLTHSSMESLKTISDLEKIIQDKNRKITTMQTEITYIKSAMAESGLKLIDTTKELEVSRDTCDELSTQLKKIVQHKNEEIAELKRQVMKMSVTENRASQIIKVSAKYQAMILKRIAEIKSTAVLKELTNFGNTNTNSDSELRRSLTAGSITMEDLESFLETTDRHLKRCSEKQIALQKDRDRLSEVNRINESEIISMKKFLTEMSLSFRTFTTVKDVYSQKLSKIVSIQRMVRRDVLSLEGHITEAMMCKLERGYAAVMQDLSECAMNIERWVDRSVSRMMSQEKIQQAFTSEMDQASLSTANYQNAAIEVQLSELENSFQKLLGEIARAQKGEGARSSQEVTIMEVRAEYEDKLNRMKAKMKELFHEEMGRLKHKQSEEIAVLERELVKSRDKLAESSRAYEEHIRALTTELWSVGEKFLVKKEEADWLRKKQSGSLMSLQHVHSSGLHVPRESEVIGRPSDTLSLRSLPMHNKQKTESRGLHMSDEEGEVFDNRFLKELAATPRASLAPGQRISELKRRNSLVPPHLKSSYPAEMQFAPTLDEEDIKCAPNSTFSMGGRQQRKEVGITAYKKPGPPTPSKQAGRLSATDSELRESLRVEADPNPGRKTSTPSRIRSLFRSHRTDADESTPRSRRFSSIFRKK